MIDQKIGLRLDVDNVPNQHHQQGGMSSTEDEFYEIKVEGHQDQDWSEWLDGLEITHDSQGNSLLTGVISNQAALHGVKVKIRDLGLPLISLKRMETISRGGIVVNTVMEYPDTDSENPQYAGLSSRLKAFAFDFIIMFAYIIVLFGVTTGVIKAMDLLSQPLSLPENPLLGDAIAFITLILPVVLYFTLLESSPHQATWGKRKAGLRVVNADGGRLTRRQAFVRSLLKFLPWQVAHTSVFHIEGWPFAPVEPSTTVLAGFVLVYVLIGIYIASVLISKKHRTPYDWVAGSYVIVVH